MLPWSMVPSCCARLTLPCMSISKLAACCCAAKSPAVCVVPWERDARPLCSVLVTSCVVSAEIIWSRSLARPSWLGPLSSTLNSACSITVPGVVETYFAARRGQRLTSKLLVRFGLPREQRSFFIAGLLLQADKSAWADVFIGIVGGSVLRAYQANLPVRKGAVGVVGGYSRKRQHACPAARG